MSDPPPRPDKPLRAVAFDLDGLMVNSEDVYLKVGRETLRRRGCAFTDELRHEMMGQPAAQALAVMINRCGLSDTVEELAAEGEQLFWEFAQEILRPMPGLDELIEAVDERGLPRGIVTSGARRYAQRLVEMLGLSRPFAFVISADDITHGKPHPEPYLKAAERFGVTPPEMMVLEDSGNGCRAGVAAGAYTVAVPNHHTASHDHHGAAFIASSLADERIASVLAARG